MGILRDLRDPSKFKTLALQSEIFSFTAPKVITVIDWRLGLANRLLQCGVLVYFLFAMIALHSYEEVMTPTGSVSAFVDTASFYEYNNPDFCASINLDYVDRFCGIDTVGDVDNSEFWCDTGVECTYPLADETHRAGEQTVAFYTYVKDSQYTVASCESLTSANCTSDQPHFINQSNGRCACYGVSNQMPVGVEGLTLYASHTVEVYEDSWTNVRTFLRKEGCKLRTGETEYNTHCNLADNFKGSGSTSGNDVMGFTIEEILDHVGISDLNEPNNLAMKTYPPTVYPDQVATYRLTGVEIELRLVYGGSVSDSNRPIFAALYVFSNGGYHNFGTDLVYGQFPGGTDASYSYHSLYRRGIKIRFTTTGSVGRFDPIFLVVQVTSFVVLISVTSAIVTFMAFQLFGYKSKVYYSAANDVVTVSNEHARTAAQTVMAAVVFDWIRSNTSSSKSTDVGLTAEEMASALSAKTSLPHNTSTALMSELIKTVQGDSRTERSIPFHKFADLLTNTQVRMRTMQRRLLAQYNLEHMVLLHVWEHQVLGEWQEYDEKLQRLLESEFSATHVNTGEHDESKVQLPAQGHGRMFGGWVADLDAMVETSQVTWISRPIRRVPRQSLEMGAMEGKPAEVSPAGEKEKKTDG